MRRCEFVYNTAGKDQSCVCIEYWEGETFKDAFVYTIDLRSKMRT